MQTFINVVLGLGIIGLVVLFVSMHKHILKRIDSERKWFYDFVTSKVIESRKDIVDKIALSNKRASRIEEIITYWQNQIENTNQKVEDLNDPKKVLHSFKQLIETMEEQMDMDQITNFGDKLAEDMGITADDDEINEDKFGDLMG